jgi:hypothetical protein
MANGDMTWERWQTLTDEQKEWEHFQYHSRLNNRLDILESGKIRRGLIQFFGTFAGGFSAVIALWFTCKDSINIVLQ